jgi:hypothetical protein
MKELEMITRWAVRLLLVVLVPSTSLAQGTQNGSPVTGDIRPIVLHSGVAESNAIFANLAGGAAVDDNNNNSVTHPIAGEQYFLDPSVAIQETRRHLAWDASYSPTLRVYVPSSSQRDVFNQSITGALHYDATKRLGIGLRQDYLRTSDPFEQLGENPLQPGLGLGYRSGALSLPNFRRTELLSQAEINYRLTKHTSLGIDGAFKQINGNEVGVQRTSLIDTHDTLGSAFLSHQLTARQAFGVQYLFLDIVFPGQDAHTVTHGVVLFYQMAITPHMSFAVFAGPEYSEIHNQLLLNFLGVELKAPVSSTLWSPSGGATFAWSGDRLGLLASYVRRISDGGGIEGAVELNDGLVNLRCKLGRHWAADLNGELNEHALLDEPGIYNLRVLELGAGIHYQLRQHLSMRAQYQRLHHIGGSDPLLLTGNHNRVTVGIERNFTFPIGR